MPQPHKSGLKAHTNMHASIRERLIESSMPVTESGCWLWLGRCTNKDGDLRPIIGINYKQKIASRVSYEEFIGPIPTGLYCCHKCDVTICINPDHLFVGTQKDNIQDCKRKGRLRAQRYPEQVALSSRKTVIKYANNRKSNVRIEAFGKNQTLSQWGRETGLAPYVISWRIRHGWSVEATLSIKSSKIRPKKEEYLSRRSAALSVEHESSVATSKDRGINSLRVALRWGDL